MLGTQHRSLGTERDKEHATDDFCSWVLIGLYWSHGLTGTLHQQPACHAFGTLLSILSSVLVSHKPTVA